MQPPSTLSYTEYFPLSVPGLFSDSMRDSYPPFDHQDTCAQCNQLKQTVNSTQCKLCLMWGENWYIVICSSSPWAVFLGHVLSISLEFSRKANAQLSTGVMGMIMNPQICFPSSPGLACRVSLPLCPAYYMQGLCFQEKMQAMVFGTRRCPGKQVLRMDSDDITGQMADEKLSAIAPQQSLTLSVTENCDGEQVQNGASVRLGQPGLRQQPLCRCWSSPRLRTAASNKQSYLLPLSQPEQSDRASRRVFVKISPMSKIRLCCKEMLLGFGVSVNHR